MIFPVAFRSLSCLAGPAQNSGCTSGNLILVHYPRFIKREAYPPSSDAHFLHAIFSVSCPTSSHPFRLSPYSCSFQHSLRLLYQLLLYPFTSVFDPVFFRRFLLLSVSLKSSPLTRSSLHELSDFLCLFETLHLVMFFRLDSIPPPLHLLPPLLVETFLLLYSPFVHFPHLFPCHFICCLTLSPHFYPSVSRVACTSF